MNYFIDKHIEITKNSIIEYQIDTSGGKRYDAIVGFTNRLNHKGKYGFLVDNNDIFGNGFKFKNKSEALEAIKSNIKSAINMNEYPLPILKIDGVIVEMFEKIKF